MELKPYQIEAIAKIKTPSQLKYWIEVLDTERFFFTRNNMKFAGDTMRNYGLRTKGQYFELYRKKPVKHGLQTSAFFDKATLKRVLRDSEGNWLSNQF